MYEQKVKEGSLRRDANQLAMMNVLLKWGDQYIAKESRLLEFKDEIHKVTDFGQLA